MITIFIISITMLITRYLSQTTDSAVFVLIIVILISSIIMITIFISIIAMMITRYLSKVFITDIGDDNVSTAINPHSHHFVIFISCIIMPITIFISSIVMKITILISISMLITRYISEVFITDNGDDNVSTVLVLIIDLFISLIIMIAIFIIPSSL